MSIRCSALGHKLTEKDETVKSEDGDVTVIKKVKTCDRCDYEQIIHERKSVSIAEAEAEAGLDAAPETTAPKTTPGPHSGTGKTTLADGGGGTNDDTMTDYNTDTTPNSEDAIIIDDTDDEDTAQDSSTDERAAQSSSAAERTTDTPKTQGTRGSESHSSGNKAPPTEDDGGIILGDDDSEDISTPPTDTTHETDDGGRFDSEAFNGAVSDDETNDLDGGDILTPSRGKSSSTSSETAKSLGGRTGGTTSDGDLTCDTCRFNVAPSGTPIRIGDICPNCKEGYIEQV